MAAAAITKTGTARDDALLGKDGNDDLYGGGGADILMGGDGDDRLQSGGIYDIKTRTTTPDDKGDLLYGGDGDDELLGSHGGDALYGGAGDDYLNGGGGEDVLKGEDGDDVIYSGAPYDYATKTFGTDIGDRLEGGRGDDILVGSHGNDTLDGGSGNNQLYGEEGNDTYLVRDLYDWIVDTGGIDSGVIYADWYKTTSDVENWTWAPGVQKLPNWIDALVIANYGHRASGQTTVIEYHFAETAPNSFDAEDKDGFTPFNAEQRAFARQAFDYISTVANIEFRETSQLNGEDVLVLANNTQTDSSGYATIGKVLLAAGAETNLAPSVDNFGVLTLLHEIGHALWLKHPFEYSDAFGKEENGPYLNGLEDQGIFTLMSYNTGPWDYHMKYSVLDLAALHYLYGPAATLAAGDTTWTLSADKANFIADGQGIDTIDGSAFAGDMYVDLRPGYWGYLGKEAQSIVMPGQVTVNFGSVIENLRGGAGNDVLYGNEAVNQIWGGDGDDWMGGGWGSDKFDGGAGTDVVAYTEAFSDFQVKIGANGTTVTSRGYAGNVDFLTGVELLRFDDTMVTLQIDGVAGQAYRLYQAAFNRTPDREGLGYWIDRMEKGASLTAVAAEFIASREFTGMYGAAPSSSDFLTNLYKNTLHRAPDQDGFDYWLDVLDKQGGSRTDVLAQFSESRENVAALVGVLEGGIAYIPFG